jgi:hypothetical protein
VAAPVDDHLLHCVVELELRDHRAALRIRSSRSPPATLFAS